MEAMAKSTEQSSISMMRGARVAKSSRKVSLCMEDMAMTTPPTSRTCVFSSMAERALSCSRPMTRVMRRLTTARSAPCPTSHAAASMSLCVVEL